MILLIELNFFFIKNTDFGSFVHCNDSIGIDPTEGGGIFFLAPAGPYPFRVLTLLDYSNLNIT